MWLGGWVTTLEACWIAPSAEIDHEFELTIWCLRVISLPCPSQPTNKIDVTLNGPLANFKHCGTWQPLFQPPLSWGSFAPEPTDLNCAEHEPCRTWYMNYDHSTCRTYHTLPGPWVFKSKNSIHFQGGHRISIISYRDHVQRNWGSRVWGPSPSGKQREFWGAHTP